MGCATTTPLQDPAEKAIDNKSSKAQEVPAVTYSEFDTFL